MQAQWDASREYRPVRLGMPKSRPWTVAIVSEGNVSGHAGEFTSKLAATVYADRLAAQVLGEAA